MPHRYFTTEISDGTAVLRGADAHHLSRVMRGKLGDTVILCDGSAVEYTATITGFGDETVEFSVEPGYPSAAEPTVDVTLLVGYPKQDKLEQVIRHGVELGCDHFIPFFSRYCVAAPKKEEQKNERYNRIAFEAAKQCGRCLLYTSGSRPDPVRVQHHINILPGKKKAFSGIFRPESLHPGPESGTIKTVYPQYTEGASLWNGLIFA